MEVTTVHVMDDLDSTKPAEDRLTIGLNNQWHSLDLTAENSKTLREVLAPWLNAAKKVATGKPASMNGHGSTTVVSTKPAPKRPGRAAKTASNAQVREWARATGKAVSDRGRIPESLIAEYHNAH